MPGVTIIRYGDFIHEPEQALRTLAEAIGLEVGPEDIADAVAFASLPNLKEREREGYFSSSRLRFSSSRSRFAKIWSFSCSSLSICRSRARTCRSSACF